MKSEVKVVLGTLTVLFLAGFSLPAGTQADDFSELEAATAALEKGEYDKVMEALTPLVEGGSEDGAEAAVSHFLLGSAYYQRADKEIQARREGQMQKLDVLEPNQVEDLKAALKYFQQVHVLDPSNKLAPESLYMAALVRDYGYLQRFGELKDAYRKVVELYPGTEAAEKAEERIKRQDGLFHHYLNR